MLHLKALLQNDMVRFKMTITFYSNYVLLIWVSMLRLNHNSAHVKTAEQHKQELI